jgi:UDP-N-acetylmuramoyl-L-alanyl-D-glutamate--2,6-diaminopimelate ligase
MKLSILMAGTGARRDPSAAADPVPAADPEIVRVTGDSREVVPGACFFALPGAKQDGHRFAADAAARGAAAVVAERPIECSPALLLLAPSARRAMAIAAANLHGRPGDALKLAGVTGTNGKTTITYLVEACAAEAGLPIGVVGTITYRFPGVEREASHTTPESTAIQALLAEMRDAGTKAAVMEVSSHALAQDRIAGMRFAAAGFTNLTRDHLDYHGDMETYFAAKRRLFAEHLAEGGTAVVNARDPYGVRLADQLGPGRTVWRYGIRAEDALRAEDARLGLSGIAARFETPRGAFDVRSPLTGAHNLENLLCAAGLALALGIPPDAVARGLSRSPGAPGRLQKVEANGVAVFVDYAHTDDALARALAALRALSPRRLICLFGCGGDRDRGKRPLMGRTAATGADLAVVTSDNPRTEDPAAIIADILPGVGEAGRARLSPEAARRGDAGYVVEPDRRAAIALAVACARPGDAVLLAGKGHEDYQIIGKEKRHFSDLEEARRALGIA